MSKMKPFQIVFAGASVALIWLSACTNTNNPTNPPITADPGKDSTAVQTYACRTLDTLPNYAVPGIQKAVGAKDKHWPQNATLKIGFIGGDETQRTRAKASFADWQQYVNLNFTYPAVGPYDLRVSFNPSGGAWSFIGTDAKWQTNQNSATINLGFTQIANGIDAVGLHEIGHALCLTHEQGNYNNPICWNKEVVYEELGRTNGWTRQMVDDNVFRLASPATSDATAFDPLSIMLYQIPGRWTCNGQGYAGGRVLSPIDRAFIGTIYPKVTPPPPPPPTTKTLTATQVAELKADVNAANAAAAKAKATADRILGQ